MADEIPISGLPAVTAAALSDTFPVVQGGVTKKETLNQANIALQQNNFSYLEITNAMIVGDSYSLTNPLPSIVRLRVTSGPYSINMPAATAFVDGASPKGKPTRFIWDTGATASVNFLDFNGATIFSTTQAGTLDVSYTTNATAAGTPWTIQDYVTTIGPQFKYGNVTLALSDISDAGTAAAEDVAFFLQTANNLSDLANNLTARNNLGLNGTRTYSGTSDTLALTDVDTLIRTTSGSAVTQTVPPHSDIAFPAGAKVYIMQGGDGQVTIAPGSGVTLLNEISGFKTFAKYTVLTLIQTDIQDTWVVSGNTST